MTTISKISSFEKFYLTKFLLILTLFFTAFLNINAASAAISVGQNVDTGPGTEGAGICAEGTIAINPTDPNNLFGAANYCRMYSLDAGRTWTWTWDYENIDGDSNVAFDTLGNAYWQGFHFNATRTIRGIGVAKSTNKGATFSGATVVYAPNDGYADQGWMAIDNDPASFYRDNIYVVWSQYSNTLPGISVTGFALLFSRSTDGGLTFSPPIDISFTTDAGQEAHSSITTGLNGELYVTWVKTNTGNMYFKKSTDGGLTWSADSFVRAFLPGSTGGAPDVRANPTIVVDRGNGPNRGYVYISSGDVNTSGGFDSWIIRSTNGGTTWSAPKLLSNGAQGAFRYYFHPKITVAPNGRIDAVWYDTRANTSTVATQYNYDLYYSYSTDGGLSFAPSTNVSNVNTLNDQIRLLYEYQGLASDNTRVFPFWTDYRTRSWPHQYTAQITHYPPTVVTNAASAIKPTSAKLNGTVNENGDSGQAYYEYWTGSATPPSTPTKSSIKLVSGTNTTSVAITVSNLSRSTIYFYRIVANNANGTQTTKGSTLSFKTSN